MVGRQVRTSMTVRHARGYRVHGRRVAMGIALFCTAATQGVDAAGGCRPW